MAQLVQSSVEAPFITTPAAGPSYLELGIAQTGFWPPVHRDLSQSPARDSGSADIDAEGDRVAVVWAEGSSAQGQNDGRVKLAFAQVTPIQATPTTLVIDQEGRVAARIIGQLASASILSTLVADTLAEDTS